MCIYIYIYITIVIIITIINIIVLIFGEVRPVPEANERHESSQHVADVLYFNVEIKQHISQALSSFKVEITIHNNLQALWFALLVQR